MSALPVVVVLTTEERGRPPYLDELAGRVNVRFTDAAGLSEALPGARVLYLWDFFSPAVAGAWAAADALEWVHVAAAGVDSLLFDDLRTSEVVVTNARGVFDRPIAEFVLASLLARAKLLHESRDLQRQHRWQHRESMSLAGSRALVVGTGAIAREIGRLLAAVGVQVRGAGRQRSVDDPDFGEVMSSLDLPAHVGWADHVVNATPLTATTSGLFDAKVFTAMKPGSHFVNIGRGASVVEKDLLAALHSGHLGAASLDVFETEPLPEASPIWEAPGLVVSAHLSGDVVGWTDALGRQFVQNARRWLAGSALVNVVDKDRGYVRADDQVGHRAVRPSLPSDR